MVKKKIFFVLALLLLAGSIAFAQDSGNGSEDNDNDPYEFLEYITFDTTVSAISINLGSGQIGFMDSVNLFHFSFDIYNYHLYKQNGKKPDTSNSLWIMSIGIIFTIPQGDNPSLTFGFSIVPFEFKFNNHGFGIGLAWKATGTATFELTTFSIIFPISLSTAPKKD